ncbi:N-acetyltransferase [Crocinitomicaceae bacterium CZZ-1]|uniref:N-acetyltransferase n=1 Tax=Taishania pollutisoli TaxID=2766479 RepID=A0A8J6U1N7_9FLAO|nr:GNAT family N-acetyltransferase [Taishania pollutisoli]MBC9811365.1 N-acetyltransferase [Taishania pollutisoli]MBX2947720.1 N-acetyltransferase [Crocinitomicaceae bacterium]NGF75145.1 N-acetyltransferase [Fluviicola sp. SGL-29]
MEVKQLDNGKSGKFVVSRNDERIGSVSYTWKDDRHISIDYVEVRSDLRGNGLGYRLFLEVMNEVRRQDLKVTPVCSFAVAAMERTESLWDLRK